MNKVAPFARKIKPLTDDAVMNVPNFKTNEQTNAKCAPGGKKRGVETEVDLPNKD